MLPNLKKKDFEKSGNLENLKQKTLGQKILNLSNKKKLKNLRIFRKTVKKSKKNLLF